MWNYIDTDDIIQFRLYRRLMPVQKAEIEALWREYDAECEDIADICEAEGYPRYGSNYDLRCENTRKFYEMQEQIIIEGGMKNANQND